MRRCPASLRPDLAANASQPGTRAKSKKQSLI